MHIRNIAFTVTPSGLKTEKTDGSVTCVRCWIQVTWKIEDDNALSPERGSYKSRRVST